MPKLTQGNEVRTPYPVILDLGTGSGCLLASILYRLQSHHPYGIGLDTSREALDIADYNLSAFGMHLCSFTIQGKFKDISMLEIPTVHVVICNPPYHTRVGKKLWDVSATTYEPGIAQLVDNPDRLVHYRDVLGCLTKGSKLIVAPGAILIFEVFHGNAEAVSELMTAAGLEQVRLGTDSSGCIRTAEGFFPMV